MVDQRMRERFWPLCWIGEIQMYTDPAQWQHIPTEQNLADLSFRGTGLVELAESPVWWNGPEWLSKKKSEWLKMQPVDHPPTVMPEMKQERNRRQSLPHTCCCRQTNLRMCLNCIRQLRTTVGWRLDPKHLSNWS